MAQTFDWLYEMPYFGKIPLMDEFLSWMMHAQQFCEAEKLVPLITLEQLANSRYTLNVQLQHDSETVSVFGKCVFLNGLSHNV